MHHVRCDGAIWSFRIPRHYTPQATACGVLLAVVSLAVALSMCLFVSSDAFPGNLADNVLIPLAIVAGSVILGFFGGIFYLLHRGVGLRYQVCIDLDNMTIIAYDLWEEHPLWELPFDPDQLYLSRIPFYSRYIAYLQYALVYGHPCQDIVIRHVPTPQNTVLAVASRRKLQTLRNELAGSAEK